MKMPLALFVLFADACIVEKSKYDLKLNATAFLTLFHFRNEDCLDRCYENELCQSYNLDFWTLTCHLLNISVQTHPEKLIEAPGWMYMTNIEHHCYTDPEPCHGRGICTGASNNIRCLCQVYYGGKRCEQRGEDYENFYL